MSRGVSVQPRRNQWHGVCLPRWYLQHGWECNVLQVSRRALRQHQRADVVKLHWGMHGAGVLLPRGVISPLCDSVSRGHVWPQRNLRCVPCCQPVLSGGQYRVGKLRVVHSWELHRVGGRVSVP